MRRSCSRIVSLYELLGSRVRMVRCLDEEPAPPTIPQEFESWCESGKSGRPIQTHLGDYGVVQTVRNEEAVLVRFDDGDERLLCVDELSPHLYGG